MTLNTREHEHTTAHHRNREPRTTKADCTNTMNFEPHERQAHGLAMANVVTNTQTSNHTNDEHTDSQRRTREQKNKHHEPPERQAHGLATTNGVSNADTNEPRAHEHRKDLSTSNVNTNTNTRARTHLKEERVRERVRDQVLLRNP